MQLFISSRCIFDSNVHQRSLRVYPLDHLEHVFMLTTVLKLLDKQYRAGLSSSFLSMDGHLFDTKTWSHGIMVWTLAARPLCDFY